MDPQQPIHEHWSCSVGSDFDPEAEQAFVAAVLAGDVPSHQQLMRRLGRVPRMLSTRNAALGGPLGDDELDDVVQETLITVLGRLENYRPVAPLEAWIYGICALKMRAALRRKGDWARKTAPLPAHVADTQDSPLKTLEEIGEAHAILETLGGIEAEVIRLKLLEELTFPEIGKRVDIPENTARTYYYRGLVKLRQHVQPKPNEETTA